MVRIGIAGIGFMGMIHYLAAQKLRGAQVVAIQSRDERKLAGDWTGIQGNFGPRGTRMDLGKVKGYARLEEMLADPSIDLIDVCTPTAAHEAMVTAAFRAGKHVLVEKPIALETTAADAMVRAAEKAGKMLMVAQVLAFFPEFAFAHEAVQSKRYGQLLGGHLKRVISRPDWSADIGDSAKTGGPAIDLHIHDTHFLSLVAGVPKSVFSSGRVEADGSVSYLTTNYLYPHGPALSCSSGALAQKGRPFVHGYELYFEKATLVYESGTCPLTVIGDTGESAQPKLAAGDGELAAFTAELQTAVDSVTQGKMHPLLSGAMARDALVLCQREIESVKTGQILPV